MPDFSLLGSPNFAQGALAGYQAGKQISQQNEREGALKGYLANTEDPVALTRLAGADPSLGLPLMERRRKEQERDRIGKLAAKAAAGDHDAASELWSLAPDLATRFDERTQKLVKEGTDAIGQAALRISALTDDQIPVAADMAIEALSQQYPNLARYKGHIKTRADLDAVLDQTGMTDKAIEMRRPRYQVGPPGGVLLQTNPLAGDVGTGVAPPAQETAPVPDAAVEYLRQNPQFAPQFDQKYGSGASKRYLEQGGAGSGGPQTFP